jgi:hypothetical protein
MFKHNEAFSFRVATDDQEETAYWAQSSAMAAGRARMRLVQTKWGVSWQIRTRADRGAGHRGAEAKRVGTMMDEEKIDVAAVGGAARLTSIQNFRIARYRPDVFYVGQLRSCRSRSPAPAKSGPRPIRDRRPVGRHRPRPLIRVARRHDESLGF